MPNLNTQSGNLTLLGYSSKREYFGNAVSFREVDLYNYEYTVLDFNNLASYLAGTSNLSQAIQNEFKKQIGIFSGDANITSFEIVSSPNVVEEQIRAGKYNISVEVRKPIQNVSDVTSSDPNYIGIDTIRNNYLGLNNFTESFSFEEGDTSRKIKHDISFELRSGGAPLAKTIASGVLKNEPTSFGLNILPGYLGTYSDANSFNYYSESYDLFKNSFTFSKNKEIYKGNASQATVDVTSSVEFSTEGFLLISETIKARGNQTFNQALSVLNSESSNSYSRCSTIFNNYKNYANINSSLTLLSTPINSVKRYNVPAFEAELDQKFTSNPIYSSSYKKSQSLSLDRDINGINRIKNDYTFSPLKNIDVSDFSVNLSGILSTISPATEVGTFYTGAVNIPKTISEITTTSKVSNRKKEFMLSYDYSDDIRYNSTVNGVTFKNLDITFDEKYPQDQLKEYKVINKATTLVNYAYQQNPGEKKITYKARRVRPSTNQFLTLSLPSSEILALHLDAVKRMQNSFNSNDLVNYYLNKTSFTLDNQNSINFEFSVSYTRKRTS
jgi:hypothetical protein